MGYARSICEDKPVGAFSFTLEKKRRARDRQAQVFSFAMRHLATSCATAAALDRPRGFQRVTFCSARPANVLMPRRVSGLCAGTGAGAAVRQ
jgi:hypothetical protein